jgi:hypothetical protein
VCDRVCDIHGSSDDGIKAVQAGKESKGRAHTSHDAREDVKDGEMME